MEVRELRPADAVPAAELHARYLPEQFLARGGPWFLRRYHRAFTGPYGLALVADAGPAGVVGLLLGSTDAARFYAELPRHHGRALSMALAGAALAHPGFGLQVARTRLRRYARWLGRRARPARVAAPSQPGPVTGEVTVVVVSPQARGTGAGRALVAEAVRRARAQGAEAMELVTGLQDEANGFYCHLGWQPTDEIVSASGEPFRRWRLVLAG